eukprot:363130-Chlamydomonas_euryale.AAC.3
MQLTLYARSPGCSHSKACMQDRTVVLLQKVALWEVVASQRNALSGQLWRHMRLRSLGSSEPGRTTTVQNAD